jgi:hypothetical protein
MAAYPRQTTTLGAPPNELPAMVRSSPGGGRRASSIQIVMAGVDKASLYVFSLGPQLFYLQTY